MVTKYTIRVTTGSGNRINRGRYSTKAEAEKALRNFKKSSRSDADTKNPRIVKYNGFN